MTLEKTRRLLPLRVEVVEIIGNCPIYCEGDYFFIEKGYQLRPGEREALCMHGLASLMPYYVALARGVKPQEFGLASAWGPGTYLQCLDPCTYTRGGTVIFRVTTKPEAKELKNTRNLQKLEVSRVYPHHPLVGVGGVVLRGNDVLLVRRGVPPSQGLWSLPGGGVDLGEGLSDALKREVQEECGISIQVGPVIGVFDAIYHDHFGKIKYHYVLIDFLAEYLGGSLSVGSDVIDATWVPLEECLKFDLVEGAEQLLHFLQPTLVRLRESGQSLGVLYRQIGKETWYKT